MPQCPFGETGAVLEGLAAAFDVAQERDGLMLIDVPGVITIGEEATLDAAATGEVLSETDGDAVGGGLRGPIAPAVDVNVDTGTDWLEDELADGATRMAPTRRSPEFTNSEFSFLK